MKDYQGVAIAAAAEVPYARRPPAGTTTMSLLADAVSAVLHQMGVNPRDVDGLGVASFTLPPDHAIDVAWRLGMSPRWIIDDCNGGASGINMLQHAARAVQAGDASLIVLVAGDHFLPSDFVRLVENYNVTTHDWLRPMHIGGPNGVFAMLTQRQMAAHGLTRADYGSLCVAQRQWAAGNPQAVYREPLTLQAYLDSPPVADPLCRFDCVPVVSGADALIVCADDRVPAGMPKVSVKALRASLNPDHQAGDGLSTGLALIADDLWRDAGIGPAQIQVASVYDDYPAMVLAQLADLGFAPGRDLLTLARRIASLELAVNTSGGQLSAGQAGAAAGMHGLVEACIQLRGEGGARQVPQARHAVVSGYGMVEYRYGMTGNAVVLEGDRA